MADDRFDDFPGTPLHLRDGLLRYLDHGVMPGDFLRAVLANDLAEAVGRADPQSFAGLRDLVGWVRYNISPGLRGSREAIEEWVARCKVEAKKATHNPLLIEGRFAGFVEFGVYGSGEIGLTIKSAIDGSPVVKATVALAEYPDARLDPGFVWIKTWAENEGVYEALVEAGVIEAVSVVFQCSEFAIARAGKLTPAALEELARQKGESLRDLVDGGMPGFDEAF